MKQRLRQFWEVALKVEDAILLIFITGIVIVVFLGVLIRYTPFTGKLVWTAELSRFFFLWLVFWAAGSIERSDGHYKADILPNFLSGKSQTILYCLIKLTALAGFAFLIWSAYNYNVSQVGVETQQLRWPAITRSLPILLCSLLMFVYILIALIKNIRRLWL